MNRFERRKTKTHEAILTAATSLIQARGLGELSLDDVAEHADVSRATLYNHYSDKSALLREVLEPVFRRAQDQVDELLRSPDSVTLEAVCGLCVDLWERRQDRFGLVGPTAADHPAGTVNGFHQGFAARFVSLFSVLEGRERFRLGSPEATGRMIYRCCVPILESIGSVEGYRDLFVAMVRGLVVA